jgi:Tol biopolymer transport system component
MRRTLAPLVLVLLVAAALPELAAAAPGGRFWFDNSRLRENCGESCEETGRPPSSIFTMRGDGTRLRRFALPCEAGAECSWAEPSPSPDGRTIALPGLRLVDHDGRNLRPIPGTHGGSDAQWAPGGRRLAFSCFWRIENGGSQSDVCTVALDGSGLNRLTETGGGEPTWSRRGQIAFVRPVVYQGKPRLWTMPAAGGAPRQLTQTWARHPRFSPDGRRIVYECNGGVCVIGVDGRGRRRLVRFGDSPDWSPNGRWIAFIGQRGITRMRPDGSDRTVINRASYPYAHLAWTRVPRP